MTRTFIALDLDAGAKKLLAEIIQRGRTTLPKLKWVRAESIHLTLAFLGELDSQHLEKALEAAQTAAGQMTPFRYRLNGLGTFGAARQPRVLWMGIQETSGSLEKLHAALNRALEQHGFKTDQRPFAPHLTLARIQDPLAPQELQRLQTMLSARQLTSVDTTTEAHLVHVMKSELTPSGAKYTSLRALPLRK